MKTIGYSGTGRIRGGAGGSILVTGSTGTATMTKGSKFGNPRKLSLDSNFRYGAFRASSPKEENISPNFRPNNDLDI